MPLELFSFEREEITIGRATGAGSRPCVALGDRSVSREHAAIIVDDTSVSIEDRGGRAGTFVGGRRLRGRQPLASGERFTFAGYTAWLEYTSPGQSSDVSGAQEPAGSSGQIHSGSDHERGAESVPSGAGKGAGEDAESAGEEALRDGARRWIDEGEPAMLLLRGRALRSAKRWLGHEPSIPPGEPRRRWIESSEVAQKARRRRTRRWGAALLGTAAFGLAALARPVPQPVAHEPTTECLRAELAAVQSWAETKPASAQRGAMALAWARERGCRTAAIEGVMHRALAEIRSVGLARVAMGTTDTTEQSSSVTAIPGARAALITASSQALLLFEDGDMRPIGAPGSRWRLSGDSRHAAEIIGQGGVTLWALGDEPTALTTVEVGGVSSVALDHAAEEMWIAAGGQLLRWTREGELWTQQGSILDPLGVLPSDRVEVGLQGLFVGRGGELWRVSAASGRYQSLGEGIHHWSVTADGDTLIAAHGREVRRWRLRRDRLRPETLAELDGPTRGMQVMSGGVIAAATEESVRLVAIDRRWRRRQALSRAVTRSRSLPVESLLSDPAGRWLLAVDRAGAEVWRIDGAALLAVGAGEVTWGAAMPDHLALADGSLLTVTDDRVERWPLADVNGGLDGVAVTHGEALRALAIDPSGEWIASAGEAETRLWRQSSAGALTPVMRLSNMNTSPVAALAFGEGIWAVANGESIDVRDLGATGMTPSRIAVGAAIEHLAVADDGRWLVSADARGDVAAWRVDALKGSPRPVHAWSQGAPVTLLSADPGGTQVLVGDRRGGVRGLRLGEHGSERALLGHEGAVVALAIANDGRLASSGEDLRLHIVDPAGATQTQRTPAGSLRSLAFVGDSPWLAARDEHGAITMRDTKSTQTLSLGVRAGPASGLFAGDAGRLYVIGEQGGVELWEMRELGSRPIVDSVTQITQGAPGSLFWAITPDAKNMLSATPLAGALRVRPLAPQGMIDLACWSGSGEELVETMPFELATPVCTPDVETPVLDGRDEIIDGRQVPS